MQRVYDASPLIALGEINLLGLLGQLEDEAILPQAVGIEIWRALRKTRRAYGWIPERSGSPRFPHCRRFWSGDWALEKLLLFPTRCSTRKQKSLSKTAPPGRARMHLAFRPRERLDCW